MDDIKIVNSLKGLSIDMINNAKSGHPGVSLGATNIIYTLYSRHMNVNVNDDKWINRDRFVLSGGHASALLYSMLYFMGFLTLDDLKGFRCINSKTPGHPEITTPGVDMSTGLLGEGISNAVGFAIAERYYNNTITNKDMINYYTYVMCGDGDLMEGVSYEALSLAGTLNLNKLIILYDSNSVTLDGSTDITFNEDIHLRFKSIGFNYIKTNNNIDDIDNAIKEAKNSNKPTLIEVKTIIGEGSLLEGTNKIHGGILTEEDTYQLKEKLNLSTIPFDIDINLVSEFRDKIKERMHSKYENWKNIFYTSSDLVKFSNSIDLLSLVNPFYEKMDESMRDTNGKIMNVIGSNLYTFIGGAADTSLSTKTKILSSKMFSRNDYSGKNIYYGVREHAMAGISNGLASAGLLPFASTFLVFSDHMKPSIRMSALMDLPVTYVFTHDSITIGSDGATHEPVEQLDSLRSIPNFRVFRPADAREILGSWNEILNNPKPSAIVLSRNNTPLLKNSDAKSVSKGAYIVKKENGRLSAIIIASGEEVNTVVKIAEELEKDKIYLRVVSMVSESLYEQTCNEYKASILPNGYKCIVVEYSNSNLWYKYIQNKNYLINLNSFGKSGTKEEVLKSFDLDYETLKERIKGLVK
ncbi:MAG: transketolase [Bacilli bacterium]